MSELTASVDQTTTEALPEPTPDTRTELERVEALLRGEDETKTPETAPETATGGDPKAAQESDEKGEPDEQETDPEAAKAFYAQEVKLSNGESMTIGALKDLAQEHATHTAALIERENRVMTQYNELQEMGQYLQLPPEMRERIQQQQTQHLTNEHNRMLDAIPEFKDQAAFEKGRAAMFDLGKEYGVDLSRVADHRVVKMLHDFCRLKAGIKTARETVKQIRTPEPKAKTQQINGKGTELSNAVTRAKQTGNQADQQRAVELLLRG